MDEAEEILLSSLRSSGVSLPSGLSASSSSIKGLSPDALVSVCAQSLRLIRGAASASLPTSIPDAAAERFKVCADVAAVIKSIGYKDDLSFHQFLYPTNEESYKLLRFLVERLSESILNTGASDDTTTSHASDSTLASGDSSNDTSKLLTEWPNKMYESQDIHDFPCTSGRSDKELREISDIDVTEVNTHGLLGASAVPGPLEESDDAGSLYGHRKCDIEIHCKEGNVGYVSEQPRNSTEVCANKEDTVQEDSECIVELEQTLASLRLEKLKLRNETECLKDQEKSLKEKTQSKVFEIQGLEAEYELLKAAVKMAFDDQHSIELCLKELNEQAEARRGNLVKLEMQWNALKGTAEVRPLLLEQSMHAQKPELQERLLKLKEIKQVTEATVSEIHRREVEHAELIVELDKLPKVPSRKYYIDRVTEITKNSWKQDTDLHRILKEIREVQLESNSIQERLHRTYAVVEETVFRDAKNDPVGRQAYRLLTSIHDIFEQIVEKIRATDKARKEGAEQEKKLAAISSRNFDIQKLQADLDSIRKENELLEQQLYHN
ncbi:uncharacterized protein LOC103999829 isoform X1 [Musa acuminata AAA Group]|uniref:(wild Malaysian banana) hypothetical protein n=1 Tax=Musa acuminata subsp. malaccensis TaxID=214687 RepID=A0A804KQX0_MUSAM|nr:PREDICTED: coiled-coil domain-containing protein 22 homolog isoform X1 [Musa acuminata subsp. malaccensis]CAG1852459.1 unnamed protein product [Musa acuminata subsp. malaccensis]